MGIQINTQPQTFKSASTVMGASAGLSAVSGLTVYGDVSASGTLYGVNSTLAKNEIVGTGGTTYTLATYPSQNAEDYIVAVDGVIQTAGTAYSLSGNSLIFTAAVPVGSTIVALAYRGVAANSTNVPSFKKNEFTTNGGATYTLSYYSNNNAENYLVFLDGVMQSPTTDYTISGSTITIIPAPASGVKLVVMSLQNADGTYATTAAVDITGKIDKPSSPSAGQVLTYNGTTSTWVASAAPGSSSTSGIVAWVNFNGARDTTGAVSTANTNRLITGSSNVSSVLRNALGDFTINFTNPLASTNYAFTFGGGTGNGSFVSLYNGTVNTTDSSSGKTASSIRVAFIDASSGAFTDNTQISVCIIM